MNILNTPLRLHGLELKNRIVLPPISVYQARDGYMTDELLHCYAEKSRGGYPALILTAHLYVAPAGMAKPNQTSVADDRCLPGLAALAACIRSNGCKSMAQISHAGSAARGTELPLLGPSAVENPAFPGVLPQEMTVAQIEQTVADFAAAAARVQKAGFDGVEIHMAHGYLLNQFYSPLTNRRTDAYTGQTLPGRLRLPLAVVRAVRAAVGPDYSIALRFAAADYLPGGTTLAESLIAARELEQAGVDLFDVSGGMCRFDRPGHPEEGYFAELTQGLKQVLTAPVNLTGGIRSQAAAQRFLRDGVADLIGVGRAALADPAATVRALLAE